MSDHGGQEDFGALLREEVLAAKKRRQQTVEATGGNKYIKRGDLARGLGKAVCPERKEPEDETSESGERPDMPAPTIASEELCTNEASSKEVTVNRRLANTTAAFKEQEPETHPKKAHKQEIYQVSAMESESINPKEDFTKVAPLILLFLKRLLHEQEVLLEERPAVERNSQEGRLASSIFAQSKSSLRILFKLLRKSTVPKDILRRLAEICSSMQQREYVQANDAYLKLAIGNAPWPIGVTAVGIHERSAQEKIKTDQIAHVLNDETTRKWLQSVKRLMTFCQNKYPPKDRSKMMG